MKKFLLLMVCATMMVAANATGLSNSVKIAPKSIKLVNKTCMKGKLSSPLTASVNSSAMPVSKANKNFSFSKPAKAAATSSDFDGSWIDEYSNDMTEECEQVFNVTTCNVIKTETADDTLWVEVTGALEGYADIIGYYDATASTVTFPAQYCYDHATYGKFAFGGLEDTDEGSYLCDYVVNVAVDAAGHISMMNDEDDWCILMMEGDYQGTGWQYCESGLAFNKCNYRFFEYEAHIEDSEWTDWAEDSTDLYVESLDEDIFVHGMFGTTITMSYNSTTGYYEIPNGQPVTYFPTGTSSDYQYNVFYTYNCKIEDRSIKPVMTDDFMPDESFKLNAYMSSGNYLVFGSIENEGTEDADIEWDYMYVAKFVSASSGYFDGVHCDMYCMPLEDVDPTGIENVNATAPVVGSKAVFNLSGQQVGKNFKGIVIRDGKKVIM